MTYPGYDIQLPRIADWMLPSLVAENDTVWLISFNGLIVDARELPLEVQEEAYARGLIPYIE